MAKTLDDSSLLWAMSLGMETPFKNQNQSTSYVDVHILELRVKERNQDGNSVRYVINALYSVYPENQNSDGANSDLGFWVFHGIPVSSCSQETQLTPSPTFSTFFSPGFWWLISAAIP